MPFEFTNIPKGLLSSDLKQFLDGNYRDLYPRTFDYQNVEAVIGDYQTHFGIEDREILSRILNAQHKSLSLSAKQRSNLVALGTSEGFTVTTGQQIHPFLGPAFVWAKVKSVIDRAAALSKQTNKTIVPIFWMATEDHDFDEIKFIPFLGKQYEWERPSGGPVGNFDTQGIADILQQMQSDFQHDDRVLGFLMQFDGIYGSGISLSDATRTLIHSIFGSDGLLIVDPNEVEWKRLTIDVWLRELGNEPYQALQLQSQQMKSLGLKAPITPRQTSMFYYGNNDRLRIDRVSESTFQTANGGFQWNLSTLEQEIQKAPERFSANALLRPAYQQRILPNLVYIGGPTECLYWLQVPQLIHVHGGVIPILDLRLMMHLSIPGIEKKLDAFPWPKEMWFDSESTLVQQLMSHEYGNLALNVQIPLLRMQFEQIWESLYQIKHPQLKEIKKAHQEVLKALQQTADTFMETGFEGHIAPKLKQLKNLKATAFNETAPQERRLFWLEWAFKLGGFPQMDSTQNRYVWISF